MNKRENSNPLLAPSGSFSLSDSFDGPQPALFVPKAEHDEEDSFLGQSTSGGLAPSPTPTPPGLFLLPSSEPPMMPPNAAASAPPTLDVSSNHTYNGGEAAAAAEDICYHWFYRTDELQTETEYYWKPFDMIDSVNVDMAYESNNNSLIPVEGGRFDVDIEKRLKIPVYWTDREPIPVRRCSWFFQDPASSGARWIPYSEEQARILEDNYLEAKRSNSWNKKIDFGDEEGGHVIFHSASIMVHFTRYSGPLNEWGHVQPQDPSNRPRIVHRGLEGLPDIPDGEVPEIDHLVFAVHGIGAVCDIKMRTLTEVVSSFRDLTASLSEKHFQSAHLSGRANRIEYLPVNWHRTLHGEDTGTDERLRTLSLKSIPKLRSFMNNTLMDILFYTSPVYSQTIVNTVVNEMNRMYTLFLSRNPGFRGTVSLIGHSLGALIVFDILSHQNGSEKDDEDAESEQQSQIPKPVSHDKNLTLEEVFEQLEISKCSEIFTKEGIDMDALLMCSEDDLKEGGLPLGPRKKLLKYIEDRKNMLDLSGLEQFQRDAITSNVKYVVGPAGTGQPCVKYPQLKFNPSAFYALGSPIALFLAVRGVTDLGETFKFSTCPKFFNIFHPYDPVAYRMEAMVQKDFTNVSPVIIPHHMGRKRIHLELKDTVTRIMTSDFKKKLLEGVSYTLSSVYNLATGYREEEVQKVVSDELQKKAEKEEPETPSSLQSQLNRGHRIDYVLQEAPFESFNEYLFALAAHLCYWESEDTCLMVLKDIYSNAQIYCDEMANSSMPPTHSTGFVQISDSTSPPSSQSVAPPPPMMPPQTYAPPVPMMPISKPSSTVAPPPTSSLPYPASSAPVPLMPMTATSGLVQQPPLSAPPPPMSTLPALTSVQPVLTAPSPMMPMSTPLAAPPPPMSTLPASTSVQPVLSAPSPPMSTPLAAPPPMSTHSASVQPVLSAPSPPMMPISTPLAPLPATCTPLAPSPMSTPSTFVPPPPSSVKFTPFVPPPVTLPMVPPSLTANILTSPLRPISPASALDTNKSPGLPLGPPLSVMESPTDFIAPPPNRSGPSRLLKGKKPVYPVTVPPASGIGMDPTAPLSEKQHIGPPPKAGFNTKN